MLLPLPQSWPNPTLPSYPANFASFFFSTHQDQFLLPKCSWMCGPPWEHGQFIRPTLFRENCLSLSQQQTVDNSTMTRGRNSCSLSLLAGVWSYLGFVCAVATARIHMLSSPCCISISLFPILSTISGFYTLLTLPSSMIPKPWEEKVEHLCSIWGWISYLHLAICQSSATSQMRVWRCADLWV